MEIQTFAIPAIKLLTPRHIGDERDYFAETFRANFFAEQWAGLGRYGYLHGLARFGRPWNPLFKDITQALLSDLPLYFYLTNLKRSG